MENIAGILREAFEISERGVVIAVKLSEDTILNVGDKVRIENIVTTIKGVEMINYGSLTSSTEKGEMGLFVSGNKNEYLKLKGAKIYLEEKNDQ